MVSLGAIFLAVSCGGLGLAAIIVAVFFITSNHGQGVSDAREGWIGGGSERIRRDDSD
jgi:hypothetical protein